MKLRAPLLLTTLFALVALLFAGCHVSPKAPAHDFSDVGAATRPLLHRLRNGAEHDAAMERNGRPYLLAAETADDGALLYYGARHSRDADDPQLEDLRRHWDSFAPTVALCEGRQNRHFYGFLVEPFAGLPEPTLVHKLARADDVRLVSLEPEYADEVAVLLRRFPAEKVALYFFLRVYLSEADGEADEDLARHLLAKRTDVDGLRDALPDLNAVDTVWRRDYPDEPDWRVATAEPPAGWLAEVSDASRTARGEHMVRVLLDLLENGERVFAVVGSGHVIRQEWALRAALGLPPAFDQPPAIRDQDEGARGS
jgi:hypothetical protein